MYGNSKPQSISLDIGHAPKIQERNTPMTLIIIKETKNGIILAVDSQLNLNNGDTTNIQKLFTNDTQDIAIAYAGDSCVFYGTQQVMINDIIMHHINRHDTNNIETLINNVINDVIRFLPGDKEAFGQVVFLYKSERTPKLIVYEIYRKANAPLNDFKVMELVNNDSYFYDKSKVYCYGAVKNSKVQEIYDTLENNTGSEQECVLETMRYFIENSEYPTIGGKISHIFFKKDNL